MNRYWVVTLVFVFVVGLAVAERSSAYYVGSLRAQRDTQLDQERAWEARYLNAAEERKQSLSLEAAARQIADCIRWESDSTVLLKWFGDAAGELGLRQINCKVLPPDRAITGPGGAFRRLRVETHLRGTYWALARYVERLERSPRPMLVDSFTLAADRQEAGAGDLAVTVSCLFPASAEKPGTGGGHK